MNISKEQTSELTASIQITIEPADYQEEVNKALKDYQRKVNMPGFRPGKVPLGMVKKMYGKSLIADKVNTLISEALNNYIIDNKLAILGHPIANMDKTGTLDFDEQSELNFYFDIGLAPEFTLDLDSVKVPEYIRVTASEEAIDETINNMLNQSGKEVQVDEAAKDDRLKLKIFEVGDDGNEVDDGYQETIELAIAELDEAAQNNLIGKQAGEEFIFKFSEAISDENKLRQILKLDDERSELLAKSFNVIIDEVLRIEKAELNEDFFAEMYPHEEINDLKQFRARIAKDIEKQYERDTDRYFFNKAVDSIIDDHQFDLPDEFMKKWVIDSNEGKITAEDLDKDYANYAKTFRWQLILSKLEAENEELAVQPSEIRNFVKSYFFGRMQNTESIDEEMDKRMEGIVDSILQNKEEENKIKEQIADQKLTAFIIDRLKPKEKVMGYEEFVNLVTENKA